MWLINFNVATKYGISWPVAPCDHDKTRRKNSPMGTISHISQNHRGRRITWKSTEVIACKSCMAFKRTRGCGFLSIQVSHGTHEWAVMANGSSCLPCASGSMAIMLARIAWFPLFGATGHCPVAVGRCLAAASRPDDLKKKYVMVVWASQRRRNPPAPAKRGNRKRRGSFVGFPSKW